MTMITTMMMTTIVMTRMMTMTKMTTMTMMTMGINNINDDHKWGSGQSHACAFPQQEKAKIVVAGGYMLHVPRSSFLTAGSFDLFTTSDVATVPILKGT